MKNQDRAKNAVRRARVLFPSAGKWKLLRESSRILRKEHKARGGFFLLFVLKLLLPLILEMLLSGKKK